ncbi:MAG: nitrilase-related carbon-nitrogen hydrolase [Candidatus Babeliales bacterium]
MKIFIDIKSATKFIFVVFLSSTAYYFANGFHNIWQLIWLAPIPLCIYALNSSFMATLFSGFIAYFIGGLADALVYSHTKIGMRGFLQDTFEAAIVYAFLLILFRYIAIKFKHWTAPFIFAFGWISYEFIVSSFSIHGTNVSIAYTQLHNLPIIQIASVTGIWGISFLLILVPANIAFMYQYFYDKKLHIKSTILTLGILIATITFGVFSMYFTYAKSEIKIGVTAIKLDPKESIAIFTNKDQTIVNSVVNRYVKNITLLAEQGAKFILLPEEIVYMQENNKNNILNQFSLVAQKNKIYVIVGLNTAEHDKKYNTAYVFLPNGKIAFRYEKQHLIPFGEEAHYTSGKILGILQIENLGKIGVAICKDMDFIYPNLNYSQYGVGLMFVPAWDFGFDAWIHGRMALMRGIEGNFAIIRAAKDGLLTLSDSRGNIIAKAAIKDTLDNALLIGNVPLGNGHSFYSKFGNWFVWLGFIFLFMFFVIILIRNFQKLLSK